MGIDISTSQPQSISWGKLCSRLHSKIHSLTLQAEIVVESRISRSEVNTKCNLYYREPRNFTPKKSDISFESLHSLVCRTLNEEGYENISLIITYFQVFGFVRLILSADL